MYRGTMHSFSCCNLFCTILIFLILFVHSNVSLMFSRMYSGVFNFLHLDQIFSVFRMLYALLNFIKASIVSLPYSQCFSINCLMVKVKYVVSSLQQSASCFSLSVTSMSFCILLVKILQ
jgi:hypothetical protein